MRFIQKCWGFALPLMAMIVGAPIAYCLGVSPAIIQLLTTLGTLLVMSATVLWIVFVDSRRRWPEASAFDRFTRFITFYR
jgi:hypothetical protein